MSETTRGRLRHAVGYPLCMALAAVAGLSLGRNLPSPDSSSMQMASPLPLVGSDAAPNPRKGATASVPVAAMRQPDTLDVRLQQAREALQTGGSGRRTRAFMKFLDGMTAEEAPQVEELFRRMDRSGSTFQSDSTFEAFIQRWGELDAPGALAWLEEERGPTARPGDMEWYRDRLLPAWAAADGAAAIQWEQFHNKDSPGVSGSVLAGAVEGMAERDLEGATHLALGMLQTPDGLPRSLNALAEMAVRKGGLEGLQNWFHSLPEEATHPAGDARAVAADEVFARHAHASPEAGAAWLAAQADKPWRSDRSIEKMAVELAQKDPANAAVWSASLAPGPDAGNSFPGVRQAVQQWTAKAPVEMAAWLEQNRQAAFYDSAAAGVALHYRSEGDGETARRWLESIGRTDLRQQLESQFAERNY